MDLDTINPYIGLGDISLFQDRGVLRKFLGQNYKSFSRGLPKQHKGHDIDGYLSLGIFLQYNFSNKLIFIEVFPPRNPSFNDMQLLAYDANTVLSKLRDIGYADIEDYSGSIFPGVGISFYYRDNKIESVGIFSKGYYDKLFKDLNLPLSGGWPR